MDNIRKLSFEGQDIYVGLDVSKKSWKTCILTKDFEHKMFSQPPHAEVLGQYLRRHFPDATYHCVYEAGYFGFWIHDELLKQGIHCVVANPADVPTRHKEHRRKTDKVDARKLARNLRVGEIDPIYVPAPEFLEDRTLIRTRLGYTKKLTRCKNQIKALLQFHGVHLPFEITDRYWSRRYISWLQQKHLSRPSANAALAALIDELLFLRQIILALTKQIRHLAQEPQYHQNFKNLISIPGIGPLGAMILLSEIVEISRFESLDFLAGFAGLVPDEHSTGEKRTITQITQRRNRSVRKMIIEASWVAVQKDPALTYKFNQLTRRMSKQRAIIRIARKLLNRIRYVLINQCPYKPLTV